MQVGGKAGRQALLAYGTHRVDDCVGNRAGRLVYPMHVTPCTHKDALTSEPKSNNAQCAIFVTKIWC